ncbi:hypothetical protein KKH23_04560 [Patescibacteria group bacterium]|nr:hypothetical protein [Patescibacteria group bacterium]
MVLPIVFVGAVPQMPHQFYGTVTIDGAAAPDGVLVEAKIDGETYLSTDTLGGQYGYAPLFKVPTDDPDIVGVEGGVNGDTVEFYVGGVLATPTYIFETGGTTNLPLVATGGTALTGTLIVDTTPVKGEVLVGGASWGTAPQTRVLAVGDYTVSFGAVAGYTTPVTVEATVSADETGEVIGVSVPIAGDTGTLSVDTNPVKGYVFVDGASWGVAPQAQVLAVGSYTVSYGAFGGYTTPSLVLATVTKDAVTTKTGIYVLKTTGEGFSADNIEIINKKNVALGEAGEKGHTIKLIGESGSVASGYEVTVNWDSVTDWDGEKGFLNTTEADSDGSFEVWFKVPEAPVGTHYLWFEATDQDNSPMKEFTVVSDCDISTSSGLQSAKIYVDLWGFAKNKDVAIFFIEEGTLGQPAYPSGTATTDTVTVMDESVDPEEDEYDGTLEHELIVPGTFLLHIGTDTFHDNSAGNIYKNTEKCGSLNYVSGEWSIDLGDTVLDETGAFSADYNYVVDDAPTFFVLASTGVTNDLGTWENRRVTIPDDASTDQKYYVVGFDGKGNDAFAGFAIGATITLSTDEADVGDKITVEGEGFPANTELKCELTRGSKTWAVHIIDSEDAPDGKDDDKTNADGEFEFDIILPDTDNKDDDFEIHVYGGGFDAEASFEITGLASISLSPEFGPQGSTTTVSGNNYQNIKDKKVDVTLTDTDGKHIADIKKGVKVGSDGSFEADITIPTENDGLYKIKVAAAADDDGDFNIDESKEFRIGTIMVLMSKDESVVGDKIVLTGNGFTKTGEWNATFGDITIFEEEQCDNGLLKMSGDTPEFFVPQVQPGVYTILVWDVDAEITVETDFTVTEYTVLDFELVEAPHKFNVSIDGWNWPEVDGTVNKGKEIDFVLFNDTDDWDMDVRMFGDPAGAEDNSETAYLNKTGFLNDAWWVVPKSDTLDKGTYWINATIETDNDQEYFMQLKFVIGDVHKYISPRKATFRISDTVSFNIQHTFGNDDNQDVKGGDVKVYDPDGTLYWDGDSLDTWSKVETWYECPTSSQMASQNPMVLLDDAPIGTWTYKWRENAFGGRDTILEGSFNVEASAEVVLTEQINDINQAIDDLTSDISSVTDAIAGVQTNVNSAIQAANAAVDAANAAVEAVNAVAGIAGDAAEAADRAAEAAGKAQEAATGLTTLVYGAIGASLVAALAAIVSLMQISKRIAG